MLLEQKEEATAFIVITDDDIVTQQLSLVL
jgi:hypothetical protein